MGSSRPARCHCPTIPFPSVAQPPPVHDITNTSLCTRFTIRKLKLSIASCLDLRTSLDHFHWSGFIASRRLWKATHWM